MQKIKILFIEGSVTDAQLLIEMLDDTHSGKHVVTLAFTANEGMALL